MREIPPGWQDAELGDVIASISAGVSVNSDDRPAGDGEIGVLKTSAVLTGIFRHSENKVVPSSEHGRVAERVCGNTTIVSRMNTSDLVGASAYVPHDRDNLYLPDRLWQIRPNSRARPRWLAYLIGSHEMRQRLKIIAVGTSGSMKNISQDAFRALPILLPPIAQQERMECVIEEWDRAVGTIEALLAEKRQAKRALKQRLVAPCVSVVPPSAWRQLRLGEAFRERDERGEVLPLLAITGAGGIVERGTIERRDTSTADKSAYKVIRPGDIGYNTMRMWQGVSGLSRLTGLVSPAYTVVTPTEGVIDPRFAAYLFKLPAMIHRFWRYSQGLVDDQLQLRFEHFSEITVNLPPLSDQEEIADLFDAVDQEIGLLSRQLQVLRQQKRGLMQKLLTGEWKLGEAKVPEAAE